MPAPTLAELAPAGHDLAADPYPVYAALRDKGPVHRVLVPGSGECSLVVAWDVGRVALADSRLGNDIRHSSSWRTDGGHALGRNMLQSDPPQHTRLRRLVAEYFTPGRVAALRPRIEEIAGELLSALPEHGTADLVSRYALPLPVTVICDLLGVPAADRTVFHGWSNELVMPTSPEKAASAAGELTGYLAELTARKAAAPDGTLLSDLAVAPGITAEELLGMAFLLLVAGHETTVDLISATVHSLLTHPDQLQLLRADLGLVSGAVEESLRYNSPSTPRRSASRSNPWSSRAPGSPPVTPFWSPSPRPPATRSTSPTPTASTSPAGRRATSASGTACTTASAPRSPARRRRPPCACSYSGAGPWLSPPIRRSSPGGPAPCCEGWPNFRFPSASWGSDLGNRPAGCENRRPPSMPTLASPIEIR